MKIFLRNFTVISTAVAFTIFWQPARGETKSNQGVKSVSVDVATGNSNSDIPKIELSPGYGVNISFIKSGEIVEKVWLDNPAIATLDVDGCLSAQGRECDLEGAKVIHLRRIKPLKITQLPNSSTSLLTAIAKGKSARKVYLFQVAMGDETPNYHTLEIIPDIKINPETTQFSNIKNNQELQQIIKGLKIVNTRELINRESRLWSRIENFLIKIRMGESVNSAARKSGISMRLVNRLIELGSLWSQRAGSRGEYLSIIDL